MAAHTHLWLTTHHQQSLTFLFSPNYLIFRSLPHNALTALPTVFTTLLLQNLLSIDVSFNRFPSFAIGQWTSLQFLWEKGETKKKKKKQKKKQKANTHAKPTQEQAQEISISCGLFADYENVFHFTPFGNGFFLRHRVSPSNHTLSFFLSFFIYLFSF
jgi:hypothetical protein